MTPETPEARLLGALDALRDAMAEYVGREPAPPAAERLLSIDEAAEMLGIGRVTLYSEIQAGRLRTLKVGRRRLVPAGAVADYIGSRSS